MCWDEGVLKIEETNLLNWTWLTWFTRGVYQNKKGFMTAKENILLMLLKMLYLDDVWHIVWMLLRYWVNMNTA